MTNTEILGAPDALLGPIERQKKYVLRHAMTRYPCPVCGHEANVLEAAGIEVDAYTFGVDKPVCRCPRCAVGLKQVIPLMGPAWFWRRKFDKETT
jgi:transposase-like protein